MQETYLPGLHLLTEIHVDDASLLSTSALLRSEWEACIREYHLQKISDIFHEFDNGGYTGLICLTESHFSIHTWPEYNRANIDIYLSNFMQVNDGKVEAIMARTIAALKGTITKEYRLTR